MTLVDGIESGVRIETHCSQPVSAPQASLILVLGGGGGGRRGDRLLGPLIVDGAVAHPLVDAVNPGVPRVSLGLLVILVLANLHRLGGDAGIVGG